MALFWMASTKLKELIIKLQELLDKGFIPPSVIVVGCTGFICLEKDRYFWLWIDRH